MIGSVQAGSYFAMLQSAGATGAGISIGGIVFPIIITIFVFICAKFVSIV